MNTIKSNDLPLRFGRGLVYHVASVLLMASIPVLNKMSVSCVTPVVAAFLTNILVCTWALVGVKTLDKKSKKYIPLKKLIPIGILNSCAMLLLFYAVCFIPPYEVSFLSRSYILFAFVFGYFFLGERFSKVVYPLMLFIVFGSALVTYQGGMSDDYYLGVAAAIAGPFCYALSSYFIKTLDKNISADFLMLSTHGMSAICLLPFVWPWLSDGSILEINPKDLLPLLINSILGIYLGVRCLTKGLTLMPLTSAGVMRAFTPMVTLFYCSILNMTICMSMTQLIGCALLMLSGFFLLKR